MILIDFIKNRFGKPLKEEYEAILKNEYGLDKEVVIQYQSENIDIPQIDSITLTEKIAFAKLGQDNKRVLPNFLWTDLLNKLLKEIPNKKTVEQFEIFIGQIPDYRINASIDKISSKKFIILINSGLMLFLFRMSRIFISTCRFKDSEFGVFEPQITIEQAKELTQQNIKGIVSGKHSLPLQLNHPVTIKTSSFLTECLELYVISHELGHLFHNLNKGKTDSITEEFSADMIGYLIYKQTLKSFSAEVPEHILLPLFYTAPHFLFYIFSNIEQEYISNNIKLADTHPSAISRSWGLKGIQKAYADYDISQIDNHLVHFTKIF